MASPVGQVISHYRILEKLGGGGMGVVYKAEDTRLKRIVALKFLLSDVTQDPEARERFVLEAQAASALEHTNICSVHEIGEYNGQTFIVMGYYEGETLKNKIRQGPLPIEEVINIALQVARGLCRAHDAGIIHRDIKPANIILTSRGGVKIVDFGLAKLSGSTLLTRTGSTKGTVAYMSPEQMWENSVDARTDIWSLGVVIYEMLTGHLPFPGEHEAPVIYGILNEEPAPPGDLRADVPPALNRIVQRALAKPPGERYQTAQELVSDLEALIAGSQLSRKTQRFATRKVRKWLAGIGSVVAIAVVGLILFGRPPEEKPNSLAVLPFVNIAKNPDFEYLCDGLAETLTGQFHLLPNLKVTAFTSSLYYKGKSVLPSEIGRQLGVRMLLVTRLDHQKDNFKLHAELIDVKENTLIWTREFREASSRLNTIPQSIFLSLVQDVRLGDASTLTRISSRTGGSNEAYDLYLRARYYFHKSSSNSHLSADYSRQAISVDSNFSALQMVPLSISTIRFNERFASSHRRL